MFAHFPQCQKLINVHKGVRRIIIYVFKSSLKLCQTAISGYRCCTPVDCLWIKMTVGIQRLTLGYELDKGPIFFFFV